MTNKTFDYLIVGSGLFGATFAHQATQRGFSCLVIDKRSELGGNLRCELVEGINVHQYGAHIFHTSDKAVWDYVNSIVPFNRYTNSPVANYKGRLYNLPFNMNTFYQMWGTVTPDAAMQKIEEQRKEAVEAMRKAGVAEPRNLEEQALTLVGRDIYETLIKDYTQKQWGRKCSELPAFIIKRLPVRLTFDNNYFNDAFQGIPIGGYNLLIDGMLKDAECLTQTDFFQFSRSYDETDHCHVLTDGEKEIRCKKIVFTGKIDEFYNYEYGKLNYRTVRFEHTILNTSNHQGNAVVNYTDAETPYTRVIEHKHFESFGDDVYKNPRTVISREYSTEWTDGMEPYYPVNDETNNRISEKYRERGAQEKNVIFGGRLAEYKYYDMAPIIQKVLQMWE